MANVAAPGTRVCVACKHYQMRPKYELFSAGHLQAPGVLNAKTEWDQQLRQHAEQEAQRLAAGLPFDYEPHHYAWCAKLTPIDLVNEATAGHAGARTKLMQDGGAVMNPVTGQISAIYVVCAQANPTGQCELYDAKPNESSAVGSD